MHIDNQKNSDYGRFTKGQHSKTDLSLKEGFEPSSPVVECRKLEDQSRYLCSPGSEGSQNQKQVEANPQDDMQCQKIVPGWQNGGSKFLPEQKEAFPTISTQKVLKLEDEQVLQLQSYLQQKVSLSSQVYIFHI
jgi:hypothetical protein